MAEPQTIKLQWRRGGGWNFVAGAAYFWRATSNSEPMLLTDASGGGSNPRFDYAGPFTLEEEEPEPEMLRIEGCEPTEVMQVDGDFACVARRSLPERTYFAAPAEVYIRKPTRRAAIEAFNSAARAMGAKDQ